MARLSAEQRIRKQHVWLMGEKEYCLFSGVFLLGETTVVEGLPTACTDGVNVHYGKEFVESLSDEDLRGVIMHENMHKAFKHMFLWKHLMKKNARVTNMAMDYVINQYIVDADAGQGAVTLPSFALLDERFRGMDTQQVFNILIKEKQNSPQMAAGQAGEGDPSDTDNTPGPGQPLDEHDWEAAKALEDSGEAKEIAKQIEQALRQGQIIAGRKGASMTRTLMKDLQPQVDWAEALRDFMTSVSDAKDYSSWRRPARRWIDQGIYMPSSVSESMGPVVIAIDTSGSVDDHQLGVFLAEVSAVCREARPERVEVLYWGTRVAGRETYEPDSYDCLIDSTRPVGGGGTDVRCVPRFMHKHKIEAECAIVLTDGMTAADWGTWSCPVLVCCTTTIVAPVGTTVRIQA